MRKQWSENWWRRSVVVAGAVLVAALLLSACASVPDMPAAGTAPEAIVAEPAAPEAGSAGADVRSKGQADAPLVIVEYSDFQCPYCGRWVEQTYPTILEEYINTGKARLEFRDFPLSFHQNAHSAAVASRCAADQDAFWEMHDKLFTTQDQWAEIADPSETFGGFAQELGLDAAAFTSCLTSGRFDQAIQEDMQAGEAAGVSGTPSFVINGQLFVGAQPTDNFRAALETVLSGGNIAEPAPEAEAQQPPQPVDIPIAGAPVKGRADAPMTIVEYSDFQCPYCGQFAARTLPSLVKEYIDTGKAKLVFKDFPLEQIHPQAQKAAEAARCVRELAGNDDAFWAMHDKLFQGQQEWSGQASAAATFAVYAEEVGVSAADFTACLDSDRHAEAVQADLSEGLGFGVGGTPTFFIDGQAFVGAQPLESFRQAIAMVQQGKSIAPPPAPTPAPVPTPAPLTQEVPLDTAAGVKGDPNAPVTIVEFTDYQCPYCARHFSQTLPEIQKLIDAGTVKYVIKDFPLVQIHPQALKAAEAARCAGAQDAFWPMHDKLFAQQQEWSGQEKAVDMFKGYAAELGLDQAQFDACLDSGQFQAVIEANLQEGVGYGVRGTPGFYINRQPLPGAYPFEAFQQLIAAELGQ